MGGIILLTVYIFRFNIIFLTEKLVTCCFAHLPRTLIEIHDGPHIGEILTKKNTLCQIYFAGNGCCFGESNQIHLIFSYKCPRLPG